VEGERPPPSRQVRDPAPQRTAARRLRPRVPQLDLLIVLGHCRADQSHHRQAGKSGHLSIGKAHRQRPCGRLPPNTEPSRVDTFPISWFIRCWPRHRKGLLVLTQPASCLTGPRLMAHLINLKVSGHVCGRHGRSRKGQCFPSSRPLARRGAQALSTLAVGLVRLAQWFAEAGRCAALGSS
jgi:hypothetical protein